MNKEIPLLTANDVELRVAQIQQTSYGTYANLLLYKNARVDMRILDEVFGPMNWKRSHEVIDGKLFCTVSVWDADKNMWIDKQDVGVESNTEATKGQASDAFKRACFNIGIGRELYNAPDIRIKLNDNEVAIGSNGKPKTYAKFFVAWGMTYDKDQGCFTKLAVLDKDGNVRFSITPAKTNANTDESNSSMQYVSQQKSSEPPAEPQQKPPFQFAKCKECNAAVKSQKVVDYALKRFGRILCYDCQKKQSA